MAEEKIQTYRISSTKVDFGSPTWKHLVQELNFANIYWFLTDPIDSELVAIKVYNSDKDSFFEITKRLDVEFHRVEFW